MHMQCISPLKASFDRHGKLTLSKKQFDPQYIPFKLPCRKCLPCRLNGPREKAIRCWHESQMHDFNMFLTLTYSDEHLSSPRLQYSDFQTFMKDLRSHIAYKNPFNGPIGCMVTGEYGEETKRPHWHAIIFNYWPSDCKFYRTTDRGDKIFKSAFIDELWGKNCPLKRPNQIGNVTMDSAGYVARYAAKKLCHGLDHEHDYNPIHKTSSKNAIGKSWIEKFHRQTFENGFVLLPNGSRAKIPRYYEDWYKKQYPEKYLRYVTHVKSWLQKNAQIKFENEENEFFSQLENRKPGDPWPLARSKVKSIILEQKFKQLQERLKL